MRCSSPAGRVAAVVAACGALVAGGAAYAASVPGASTLDEPATASMPALRMTTTTTLPPTTPAPPWTTRGPGTLLFPMNPRPTCFLHDNVGESRGDRTHEGTDIGGTLGQEVYAVEAGVLHRQWIDGQENTSLSGNGWSLRAASGTEYAFLHLSGFATGLTVGSTVTRGQVIGYVGDTGNPGAGNYHLHFEVRPGGRSAAAVDPLPLLDIPTVCRGG